MKHIVHLMDKYEDVDEDARRLKIELSEAVASLKAVMKF